MKKLLYLLAALAVTACALSGCSGGEDAGEAPQASAAPQVTEEALEGSHGEVDQSGALASLPTLAPVERLDSGDTDGYFSVDALLEQGEGDSAGDSTGDYQPAGFGGFDGGQSAPSSSDNVDTSTYQFSALIDTTLGFTFNYPSHWQNVPGVYTVCYRERVEDGDFPARVSITAKTLVHTPDEATISDELTSFVRTIYRQYDSSTFQTGTPNTADSFLGRLAYSNTYLAYSGDKEIKGFVMGTSKGRTMYVFHFCATYEDYTAMESMMRYMANSATLVGE